MDIILVILLIILVGIATSILYLNLRSKPNDVSENKENEEIANLKTEITSLKEVFEFAILLIIVIRLARSVKFLFFKKLWVTGKLNVLKSTKNGTIKTFTANGSLFANNIEYSNVGLQAAYTIYKKILDT